MGQDYLLVTDLSLWCHNMLNVSIVYLQLTSRNDYSAQSVFATVGHLVPGDLQLFQELSTGTDPAL